MFGLLEGKFFVLVSVGELISLGFYQLNIFYCLYLDLIGLYKIDFM